LLVNEKTLKRIKEIRTNSSMSFLHPSMKMS
jgi:hypothetical protein